MKKVLYCGALLLAVLSLSVTPAIAEAEYRRIRFRCRFGGRGRIQIDSTDILFDESRFTLVGSWELTPNDELHPGAYERVSGGAGGRAWVKWGENELSMSLTQYRGTELHSWLVPGIAMFVVVQFVGKLNGNPISGVCVVVFMLYSGLNTWMWGIEIEGKTYRIDWSDIIWGSDPYERTVTLQS